MFEVHGDQIINWEHNKSSMINLEENNLQDEILSMVKDGDINEEEVIDFINDRTCSLKLKKEMAKLQLEYFLNQNPEEKQKK